MTAEQINPNVDIVIDCNDPETLGAFWAAALGYRSVGSKGGFTLLLPAQRAFPPVILQRVPEPKQGKTRVHFNLRVDDVESEAQRLEALGASTSAKVTSSGSPWPTLKATSSVSARGPRSTSEAPDQPRSHSLLVLTFQSTGGRSLQL
jgi:hypothetical protein